ncbi:MAG: hypothetical protein ACI3X2_11010 [Butyricicoccus porcorum]
MPQRRSTHHAAEDIAARRNTGSLLCLDAMRLAATCAATNRSTANVPLTCVSSPVTSDSACSVFSCASSRSDQMYGGGIFSLRGTVSVTSKR